MFNPFKKEFSEDEKKMFSFLRGNPFFRCLAEKELADFLPFIYLRNYGKGEVVFFRKDPSQALYIIDRGTVVLNLDIEDKFEELVRLNDGNLFGENAMLSNKVRNCNAICIADQSTLYVIPTTGIIEVFDNNRRIQAKMMTALAEFYDQANKQLFEAYRESFGFFDLGKAFN